MFPPQRTPTQRAALAAVGELLLRAHERLERKNRRRTPTVTQQENTNAELRFKRN